MSIMWCADTPFHPGTGEKEYLETGYLPQVKI